MCIDMLDTKRRYGTRRSSGEDSSDSLALSPDDPGFGSEWVLPANGNELAADSAGFIKAKLASFELLSSDEEHNLALKLASSSRAIALLTITWAQSARELLILANDAKAGALKKRMFSSEARYFALRREMDELANAAGNARILSLLIESERLQIESSDSLPTILVELISSVDWPGPLMVAFAKRYGTKPSSRSVIEFAIDEYLLQKNARTSTVHQTSDEHRTQLNHHVKAYFHSRNTLVNHNLKLVFHISKRYARKADHLPDLIQEGTLGLIRAAEKFRSATGYRFSTYAHQWIESKVRKARVNIDKVMPISHDYNNDLLRLSQCLQRHKITGSRPSFRELSREINISEERLNSVMQLKQYGLSLDQAPFEDEGLSLYAKLADPKPNFVDTILNERDADYLNSVMEIILTKRESYVINERFGRLHSDPRTLQEISHILGVSRERIRQLESSALRKLSSWIHKDLL